MTPADDLKPGMWVATVGKEQPEEEDSSQFGVFSFNPFGGSSHRAEKVRFSGVPMQILAVSLPFICVIGDSKQFAIDLRVVDVQRLNRQYVRAMLAKPPKGVEKKQVEQRAGLMGIPQWVISK
jgi:hypothetical protein